jgi:hypothetical protein
VDSTLRNKKVSRASTDSGTDLVQWLNTTHQVPGPSSLHHSNVR